MQVAFTDFRAHAAVARIGQNQQRVALLVAAEVKAHILCIDGQVQLALLVLDRAADHVELRNVDPWLALARRLGLGRLFTDDRRAVNFGKPLNDLMVLNASVLVDRSDLPKFDRLLEKLQAAEGHRMQLDCVGPLPPYSFAKL